MDKETEHSIERIERQMRNLQADLERLQEIVAKMEISLHRAVETLEAAE